MLLPAPPVPQSLNDRNLKFRVGIRPYGTSGFRIEVEKRDQIFVVHNYGQGGAGITFSWGSAEESLAVARKFLRRRQPVIVVGAGIMGLSTAYLLARAGHRVTIYAADFSPNLTSDVAGGLWSPDYLGRATPSKARQVARVARRSYSTFAKLRRQKVPGIHRLRLFVADLTNEPSSTDGIATAQRLGIIPPPRRHRTIPIEGANFGGREYRTFLVEMPLYMNWLFGEVKKNAKLVRRKFLTETEIAKLAKRELGMGGVVFNCTGVGAARLYGDPKLLPARGQLVLQRRPRNFPSDRKSFYGLEIGSRYFFQWEDWLIYGGTFQLDDDSRKNRPEDCRKILADFRRYFPREFAFRRRQSR